MHLALLIPAVLLATSSGSASDPGAEARAAVDRGVAALDALEVEGAVAELQAVSGPLRLEDVVRRDQALGVALAYLERSDEAQRVFEHLLAVAPGHSLPYTLSPKAVFVFERARTASARRASTSVQLELPLASPYGQPIPVALRSRANALDLVARWRLCVRLASGGGDYTCHEAAAQPIGQAVRWTLPAQPGGAATRGADDASATDVLQLALSGLDAAGNEVYRGPDRARPAEIPLGLEPPAPWYANPWLWGTAGTLLLAGVAGGAIALWLLQPTTARLSAEVR